MSITLLSSPLQGFTDYRFRNVVQKYFGGIDTYYAPYIRLNGKFVITPQYERDIQLRNNTTLEVIPQIMTNDADEFIFVTKYIQKLGYKELNWNLGCPYPMVINRGMGSGLINDPEKINHILDRVHSETDVIVSMKMRMGYAHNEEILDTFPILDKYPLKNIAIHARIGQQLYKGGVDWDGFERCLENTRHKIYYNGDITSVESFKAVAERFPSIDHWMIGRGLIADPFLPSMIKANSDEYPADRFDKLRLFHDDLQRDFQGALSGDKHVIMKMLSYWEYMATPLSNPTKIVKKVKKTKTLDAYEDAVHEIFENEKSLN